MTMRYYESQFWDEAPRIGAGRRFVFAAEGRVWVQLVSPDLITTRMPLDKWRKVPKREWVLTAERKRSLRKIMRKWRKYRIRTAIVKRAEQAVAA